MTTPFDKKIEEFKGCGKFLGAYMEIPKKYESCSEKIRNKETIHIDVICGKQELCYICKAKLSAYREAQQLWEDSQSQSQQDIGEQTPSSSGATECCCGSTPRQAVSGPVDTSQSRQNKTNSKLLSAEQSKEADEGSRKDENISCMGDVKSSGMTAHLPSSVRATSAEIPSNEDSMIRFREGVDYGKKLAKTNHDLFVKELEYFINNKEFNISEKELNKLYLKIKKLKEIFKQ